MVFTSWRVRDRAGRGWLGAISYKDETGRWRKLEKKLKATGKRAAELECREWFESMNAEAAAADLAAARTSQTVTEFLGAYVDGCAVHTEASTVYGYRQIIKRNIAGYGIGHASVGDVTSSDVRAWMAELSEDYGPTSICKAFVLLRSAMKQGVNDGVLVRNPTDGVKRPKKPSPKPNAIVEEQRGMLAAALAEAEQTPDVVGVRMAFYTGMREGEICALRWRDVDINARTLVVRAALGKDGGRFYLKEPKTGGSRRTVNFPDALADSLRKRRADMIELCLAAGVPFSPDMFVLGSIDRDEKTGDYRFMGPHVLWERWRTLAIVLGLRGTQGKRPTFHDLRHTFATAAIAGGVDVKTVSSALGHANAAMTLNIYADADPDAKRRAADAVGAMLEQGADAARGRGKLVRFCGTGTEGR